MRLKEVREQKGITQLELSKALNISPSAVGMYEQGRREPDFDTLKRIADYFHVSIDYLLGRNATVEDLYFLSKQKSADSHKRRKLLICKGFMAFYFWACLF